MPCRLKVQEQITLESLGQITIFLVTLNTVWFKPSNCTIMTCLASYVMSPLRPSKSPPIKKCIQPYFKVKVLWTLAEVLLNWIISQSSSGHHSTNCSAHRAAQAAVSGSRGGHCSGPGEQQGIQNHTLGVIFVLSISLWSYPSIILAICKIHLCNSNLLLFSCSKM